MDYLIESLNIGVACWGLILVIFIVSLIVKGEISFSSLVSYIVFILFSTVLHRKPSVVYKYELIPFWSYYDIFFNKNYHLIWECALNTCMMIPLGFLMANVKKEEIHIFIVIISVFTLSLGIEVIQLITKTGMFEWDDIFHGCVGTIIGYGIWTIIYVKRKSMEKNDEAKC